MANFRTHSLWIDTSEKVHFPKLEGTLEVDVAIVGAGISGITAATILKQAGKTVALLERSRVITGETGHTTAHTTEVIDTHYHRFALQFGLRDAKRVAESSHAALEQIARWVQERNIACGFRRLPAYLYAEDKAQLKTLKREFKAMKRVGLPVDWQEDIPLSIHALGAVRLDDQIELHPRDYLLCLVKDIPGSGSHVFENSQVTDFKDGEPCEVMTEKGKVIARKVIFTTNSPISTRFRMHTKVTAYRTYVVAGPVRNGLELPGMFWDLQEPYHYTRTQVIDGKTYLIVGGEDHKTGQEENTEACFDRLEDYVIKNFDVEEITHRWSGQIMEPVDGLPYIGKQPHTRNFYLATGYTGNGMTFGTLAGMILGDLVMGVKNPWASLYEPARIKVLGAAKEYVAENIDYPVCMVKDRVRTPDASSIDEVPAGEGRIVAVGGRKVAVYRDEIGRTHACSPVCPHMGCHVHWNNSEKSWDCPCHGSRFSATGEMMNGPARTDLRKVDLPAPELRPVKVEPEEEVPLVPLPRRTVA